MRAKTIIVEQSNTVDTELLKGILDLCIEIDNAVDIICKEADEKKYAMYGGNHCIQTASAMKFILDEILHGDNYESKIMYGIMTDDESHGRIYNHAYISLSYNNNYYLIDVSRKTRNALLVCSGKNFYSYGKGSPINVDQYSDIEILRLDTIPFSQLLAEKHEYFTGKSSLSFLLRVESMCKDIIDSFKKMSEN